MSAVEPATIHAAATLGAIRLTVADLERAQSFYERTIGLTTLDRSGGFARLGTEAGTAVIELAGEPDATPRPRGTTGLFHLALLVPTRADLGTALRRVAESGWSLAGASDHLVSEALYLYDPEGNGIEIYRDRPRAEWRHVDGDLQMATEPLDLDGVIAELPAGGPGATAAGTKLGHVHLNVADIAAAEAFYGGALGFDVTVRGYPGALFLSAGGYHHHVGVNTWAGGDAPPPGTRGLRWFEVVLPSAEELAAATHRLDAAGIETEDEERGIRVLDPSGNAVRLTAAGE